MEESAEKKIPKGRERKGGTRGTSVPEKCRKHSARMNLAKGLAVPMFTSMYKIRRDVFSFFYENVTSNYASYCDKL